jgi:hypothetical protein
VAGIMRQGSLGAVNGFNGLNLINLIIGIFLELTGLMMMTMMN